MRSDAGTSTFDGLSLAYATACYLAEKVRALTLFATHYFELTQLASDDSHIHNVHLDAVEHDDNIIFMHTVKSGPASDSYGLQVAQLAGVPKVVIQRAKQKLSALESERTTEGIENMSSGYHTPRNTPRPKAAN